MSDEEPPPLEDMTKDLEMMGRIASRPTATQLGSSLPSPPHSGRFTQNSTSTKNSSRNGSGTSSVKAPVKKKATQNNKGFCGFQKGFLSGTSKPSLKAEKSTNSSSETTKKSYKNSEQEDDIIRPKKVGGKSGLELPEVQEAMRETYPALATDKWLTDDLLKKVEEDPVLAKGFSDPAMMQYLNLLQTNPKQAFAAAQGNPELQKFMQAFCSIMGTHFSSLSDDTPSLGKAAPEPPPIIPEDEAKVKKLISKPEVRGALEDPHIMKLLHLLKTDPHAAQRLLSENKSVDFSSKIDILLQNDLLALQ